MVDSRPPIMASRLVLILPSLRCQQVNDVAEEALAPDSDMAVIIEINHYYNRSVPFRGHSKVVHRPVEATRPIQLPANSPSLNFA